ncbi:MAG: PAS domain S-box protein [Methanomassiliicoccales archaeon]
MSEQIRALVVDDELDVARITKVFLERAGDLAVDTAASAEEARKVLSRTRYDVIVSDYQMPKEDGLSFLSSLRSLGVTIPFILFTGKGREEVVIKALNLGADSYLQKGGEARSQYAELEHLIRTVVSRHRAEERQKDFMDQMRLKLGSVLSQDYDIEEGELANIIDAEEIQSFMDDFGRLNDIVFALVDMKGKVLVATGWQDICVNFHRRDPRTSRECVNSDLSLVSDLRPGEIRAYRCKNGLWDIVTPLYIGPKHWGNIYSGQFFYEDEEVDPEWFRARALELGFDVDEYMAALEKVPRWSRERVDQLMSLFSKFATMVSRLSLSNLKLAKALADYEGAQTGLSRTEGRIRGYLESSPLLFFVLDTSGRCLDINRRAIEVLGYGRDEVLGKELSTLMLSDGEALIGSLREQMLRDGHRSAEGDLVAKDGKVIPVLLNISSLPEGEMMIFATDISDLKRTEVELRRSEGRLQTLVRTIPDLVWLKDREGRYLGCNPSFERFFGAKESEIVGRTDHDFVPQELADFFRERDQLAIKKGGPSVNEEWITFNDDGHRALLETIKTPMFDDQGELIGILGIGRDITELKAAQEALSINEKRLSLITDNMEDYVWLMDMDMRPTWMSPSVQRASGAVPEEMANLKLENAMTPESYKLFSRSLAELLTPENLSDPSRELSVSLELEYYLRDGRTQWNDTVHIVLRGSEGVPIGILVVGRNVTERRRAERALQEALRKLNLLSSITRHDISNQLMVLEGNLSMAEMKMSGSACDLQVHKAREAAERISAIIQFTKVYEDIGVHAPTWQNVHDMVMAEAKSVTVEGVKIINEVPEEAEIFADPLITKVIHNLVDNAMRHGEKVTAIRFLIDGRGSLVCEDDGAGIPADMKDRLFTRGFGKNHGLGLFLSREILAITGITIEEQGAPGEGARFVMTPPPNGLREGR